MANTQRYLSSIKGFRKDLQEVNEKFRPEYECLERFKDSGSYEQSKKLLDDLQKRERAAQNVPNRSRRTGISGEA